MQLLSQKCTKAFKSYNILDFLITNWQVTIKGQRVSLHQILQILKAPWARL